MAEVQTPWGIFWMILHSESCFHRGDTIIINFWLSPPPVLLSWNIKSLFIFLHILGFCAFLVLADKDKDFFVKEEEIGYLPEKTFPCTPISPHAYSIELIIGEWILSRCSQRSLNKWCQPLPASQRRSSWLRSCSSPVTPAQFSPPSHGFP